MSIAVVDGVLSPEGYRELLAVWSRGRSTAGVQAPGHASTDTQATWEIL